MSSAAMCVTTIRALPFPKYTTIRRLAECTLELQTKARIRKISLKKKVYKGKQCIGLQLDMWWVTETHTAFAAITMTTVEEPTSASPTAQLWLESERWSSRPPHESANKSTSATAAAITAYSICHLFWCLRCE